MGRINIIRDCNPVVGLMARILIAEDEARLAAFIEKGLRKNQFDTAIATDGEQALQMAQSGEFDLLLLDLSLPLKNGWMVLAELEENQRSLPTIIITARNEIEDRIAHCRHEVKDYFIKPFRFNDLLVRIQVCLQQ